MPPPDAVTVTEYEPTEPEQDRMDWPEPVGRLSGTSMQVNPFLLALAVSCMGEENPFWAETLTSDVPFDPDGKFIGVVAEMVKSGTDRAIVCWTGPV